MGDRVRELIERMERERGFARPWRNKLAALDPDFMELYHERVMHTSQRTKALPRKLKELLSVCADALEPYEPGFRVHLREALKAGATHEEVLEALEVCSLVGVRNGFASLLPAFTEEVESYKGEQQEGLPIEEEEALIERMDREQGLPEQWRNIVARHDPDYMQIYHDTVMHVFDRRKALPRKVKEIIAAFVNARILCESGFRFHVRQALKAGATEEEIFEMMEQACLLGIHVLPNFLAPLEEEFESYKESQKANR